MRKELKQKLEQKKQELTQEVSLWKDNLKEQYKKRFPRPSLDKPTNHLLDDNQEDINAQSTKTTRLILKFWLI